MEEEEGKEESDDLDGVVIIALLPEAPSWN